MGQPGRHLRLSRQGNGSAHLASNPFRRLLAPCLVNLDNPAQERQSLRPTGLRVGRECSLGCINRVSNIGRATERNGFGRLFSCRIDHREVTGFSRVNPLSIDIKFSVIGHMNSLPAILNRSSLAQLQCSLIQFSHEPKCSGCT